MEQTNEELLGERYRLHARMKAIYMDGVVDPDESAELKEILARLEEIDKQLEQQQ